jgi:hypothetical protein
MGHGEGASRRVQGSGFRVQGSGFRVQEKGGGVSVHLVMFRLNNSVFI